MTLTEFLAERLHEDEEAWEGGLNLQTRPDFSRLSAKMLADVKAKRKIAALHTPPTILYGSGPADCNSCLDTWGNGYCPTLRILGLPYADHPDYDPDWAPEKN